MPLAYPPARRIRLAGHGERLRYDSPLPLRKEHAPRSEIAAAGTRPHARTAPAFLAHVGKLIVVPCACYFVLFALLTFPRILQISTDFLCDPRDGLLNVWGMWWIDNAISNLHQSPWHTRFLTYPLDVSLHGSSLNPVNGLLALPLLHVLDLRTVANLTMVTSFILSGLTSFLLAYHTTNSYFGSLVGGFIFAFSPYRFARAQGHLNLLTTQWLPVFFTFWMGLLRHPCVRTGLFAAGALFLVCLSDYYYLTYAVIGAAVLALFFAIHEHRPFFIIDRSHLGAVSTFAAGSILTTGLLVRSFIVHNRVDPFTGRHNPYGYSLDPLGLVIPGGLWRFGDLTRWYWSTLPVNTVETSVAIGVSVLALVGYAARSLRREHASTLGPWFAMFAVFLLLACGPALHIWGLPLPHIPLPYLLLMKWFPMFAILAPERMIMVVSLAAAIICAAGIERLRSGGRDARALLGLFLVVLLAEYLPAPIPATTVPFTDYPQILRDDPRPGALLDVTELPPLAGRALYYQTIHQRPMTFVGRGGSLRCPVSAVRHEHHVRSLATAGNYRELRDRYGVLYVLSDRDLRLRATYRSVLLPQLSRRGRLYDLSTIEDGSLAQTRRAQDPDFGPGVP
jgi:hypothetical protein